MIAYSTESLIVELAERLSLFRYEFANELAFQGLIWKALSIIAPGRAEREYTLQGGLRPDFWFPKSRIVLEAKAHDGGGSPAEVFAQCTKYAGLLPVLGVLLVSGNPRHASNETTLVGKPFRVLVVKANK